MTLRLNEAIALAVVNGKTIRKKDIAAKLWPASTPVTQSINMRLLCKGSTKRIEPQWVQVICDETGCDPNFLFGYEQNL